jgi:Undecaprenyl-phosphate glucose phosphotransferase
MLKRRSQLFEVFFMTVDLVTVTAAWFIAYWLRFQNQLFPDLFPPEKGIPPFTNYLSLILFIWLIWAFVFRRMGLYRPMRAVRRKQEIWLLIQANLFALLLFIAATYLFREKSVPFSRLVFVYFGIFATAFTIMQRAIVRMTLRSVRKRGYNLRYMLIVGAGKLASDIAKRVRFHQELGIRVVGCLSTDGKESRIVHQPPLLGSYADIDRLIKERDIDQVVIALPLEDNHLLPKIMGSFDSAMVDVKLVPDVYQFVTLGSAIEEFDGLPVISFASSPLDGINLIAKRVVDLGLAIVLLLGCAPIMALIALLVKLTSRGPIFYSQERISLDGSPFKIYKFRTMRLDAESSGPRFTRPGDSRVTALGRLLRKTSLDELPQLLNVLRGDMSIVGPRPERPVFIEQFRQHVPRYMLRHKVPAGMTGWAQVHGWRGDTSIEKRIEHDLYYIENWSIGLDLKIILLTIFNGFRRNAY